jgi:glycosyltransferase involved in cell wall biosynthesis
VISIVMSVYHKEMPDHLRSSLKSLLDQTVRPAQIILIKDGPLTVDLEKVIAEFEVPLALHVLPLLENAGLATALNAGLAVASQPWIMRFDTDDISSHNRVAIQLEWILSGNYDLFGAQILEFLADPTKATRQRQVPTSHDEIVKFSRRRNPFNHMTVCFRRELALRVGGYPPIPFMEDYGLWIRMISEGARTANDPRPLVLARIGNGMVRRRGGLAYIRSEIRLQHHMVEFGLKPLADAIVTGLMRATMFALPSSVRAFVYEKLLRYSA